MVVEALRKQKIGGFVQVDVARAEHVLSLHPVARGGGNLAGHHIWHPVHACRAAVTGRAQAIRAARSVQLGAAGQEPTPSGDQAGREQLSPLDQQGFAVVGD